MPTPTLINLPPPPSNPETPSDMGPGTPNSGTTSISALSTVAIKDGHRGHVSSHVLPQGQQQTGSTSATNTLEAERADRISRLAGLERMATVRSATASASQTPGMSAAQPPGYFDGANPQIKERSTVGSASATGSVGGRTTTWASSSNVDDADKMSEDHDDGISSTGALSDEASASLVGIDEGASSTISGPVSSTGRLPNRSGSMGSPTMSKGTVVPQYVQQQGPNMSASSPSATSGNVTTPTSSTEQRGDSQRIDGMTYDASVVDTAAHPGDSSYDGNITPPAVAADRIVRERLDQGEQTARALGSPEVQQDGRQGLGKFYFEQN
ncbi:MAG: hypothetical protein M1816_005554 [Peltula sp. TS41687]|nr:MAG: hypothetical protein M1816_005554 [Peltula sp. TS41687]